MILTLLYKEKASIEPEAEDDNVRIYVSLDLNKVAILRRLNFLIYRYGEASKKNEIPFSTDVGQLVSQLEIYDRIWYVRHMPSEGKHSREGIELAREFVKLLEEIPDACAELFPFGLIDEIKGEFGV